MGPITTHVLDTSRGCPAEGIAVVLERSRRDNSWLELGRGNTDSDGRIRGWLPEESPLTSGFYRLRFGTRDYFASLGVRGFYPEVVIVFEIVDPAAHYHVPLLLSPYGYTTYRGS